jgi:hypothetical protein
VVSEGRLFALETFRMVNAARRRGALRVLNAAFLIQFVGEPTALMVAGTIKFGIPEVAHENRYSE